MKGTCRLLEENTHRSCWWIYYTGACVPAPHRFGGARLPSIQQFDLLLQLGRGISGRCDFIIEYIPVAFVALIWAVSSHLLIKWFDYVIVSLVTSSAISTHLARKYRAFLVQISRGSAVRGWKKTLPPTKDGCMILHIFAYFHHFPFSYEKSVQQQFLISLKKVHAFLQEFFFHTKSVLDFQIKKF